MCVYCDKGEAMVIGRTNDQGVAMQYPNRLIAYGYDVHGTGCNGLSVYINYCPMCGKPLNDITLKDALRQAKSLGYESVIEALYNAYIQMTIRNYKKVQAEWRTYLSSPEFQFDLHSPIEAVLEWLDKKE